jgi:HEAT repeat protein
MSGASTVRVPGIAALAVMAVGFGVVADEAGGQSLEDRVGESTGLVAFHYKGKDGLEGCGDGHISLDGFHSHRSRWNRSAEECGPGPVLVLLDVGDGEPRDLDVRVGPSVHLEVSADVDLGRIPAPEAADYLLELAQRATGDVAEDAVFPAFIADSVTVWPRLIELARDRSRPADVRSQALFWVGQEAAGVATEGLAQIALDETEDQRIRESAIFAVSQRPEEEGVPILMEVARTADEAETRRSAMFWLAQSDDPRVVGFFEEVLLGRR